MAFKLKSGNKCDFKSMGSSPLHLDMSTTTAKNREKEQGNSTVNTVSTDGTDIINANRNKKANEETSKIKSQQSKYTSSGDLVKPKNEAWRDTGGGHIYSAIESIGRGIKNMRSKSKANKAEKLTSAKEAVGSGNETLKQAKTVERNRKRTANQEKRKAKSDAKDKKKLAEYRKKNPVRGKEAIDLLATQTKSSKTT